MNRETLAKLIPKKELFEWYIGAAKQIDPKFKMNDIYYFKVKVSDEEIIDLKLYTEPSSCNLGEKYYIEVIGITNPYNGEKLFIDTPKSILIKNNILYIWHSNSISYDNVIVYTNVDKNVISRLLLELNI